MSDFRRRPNRFANWVKRYTVPRLKTELIRQGHPVTQKCIYDWLAGRRDPRGRTALAIVQLAGGGLRFSDIYPAPRGPQNEIERR